jgi:hypothetical protein
MLLLRNTHQPLLLDANLLLLMNIQRLLLLDAQHTSIIVVGRAECIIITARPVACSSCYCSVCIYYYWWAHFYHLWCIHSYYYYWTRHGYHYSTHQHCYCWTHMYYHKWHKHLKLYLRIHHFIFLFSTYIESTKTSSLFKPNGRL